MKHPRHPFVWRADAARVAVILGALAAFCASPGHASKSQSETEISAPSVAIPIVTPKVDIATPALPGFSFPSVSPTSEVSEAQPPQFNASRRAYELKVLEHRRNRAARSSHNDRIEYADALIHLERYDEAIEELESIEERYADAYINAHLLSIASELSGNLPAARRWAALALERDPEAQDGTGWLRLAMIEAHHKLKQDATWLEKHSVLDGFAGRSEEELIRAVEVQVLERRELFPEKDPVLADLYFQIGVRIQAQETRNNYFALSLEAGPLRRADIEEQMVIRAKAPVAPAGH